MRIRNVARKILMNYLCVKNVPLICAMLSLSDVEQFGLSYFKATTAAMAALCCSIVPPLSKIRILFRAATGQPDALKLEAFGGSLVIKYFSFNYSIFFET